MPTYHQDLHQHSHTDQSIQTLHVDPLMNNDDPILIDRSKHDHQPVHGSGPVTASHVQVEPVSSYTTTHIQHSREQSPTNSSIDCSSSSSDDDDDDEGSNISSNVFGDSEMDPPSSTVHPHPSNKVEATINTVIHRSTSSSSSVLSDSCVSDSEDERSSVEADGQPCYGDRIVNTAVSCDQDNQDQHVSITSNLTTVTPAELSSLSDDESDEQTSSSVEDNREQDEIKMAANGESSEGLETSSATSIVTQSLLNRDETMEEQPHQPMTDNLRDITNGSSQPPPATLHQKDDQSSPPSSHSTVQKSPQR